MDTNHFFSFSRIAMVMKTRDYRKTGKKTFMLSSDFMQPLRWSWWVICGEMSMNAEKCI